ncbi:MAG: ABC transporter substrate-binding protein [Acidimicrobiia bacterium]
MVGSIAVALVLGFMAFGATAGAGAATKKQKVDTAAVLKFGAPIEANGGPWFDPHAPQASAQNPTPRLWIDLIYDTMIHNTPDGKGEPGLATKWTTPDPSTVELTLRQGVKFSDGTPFNAAAVKAAWDKLPATRPNLTANLKEITSIEAVGDNVIRIHLAKPIAQTIINDELNNSNFFAVPSPTAEAAGNLETKPVGAGPYLLKSYSTGHVVLEKNPNFYDPSQQKLAGVEFIDVATGAPSVSALQAGTVDLIWSLPPDSIQTLKSAGFDVTANPGNAAYTINTCPATGKIFASKQARQALQYAVNRKDIAAAALAGTAIPVETQLTPANPNYDKKLDSTYKFDPAKAKALLKQAGVAPGTTVTAEVPSQPPYSAIAEILQSNFKDVGLNLQITTTTNFAADAIAKMADITTVGVQPSLMNLAYTGNPTSALNICGWDDPVIRDALTTTSDASQSPAQIKAAWETLQKQMLDQSWNISLTDTPTTAASTKNVKGVDVINTPYGPQLGRVYKVTNG